MDDPLPRDGSPGASTIRPNPRAATSVRSGIVGLLPDLRAFARFLCRDRTRADDLVQEAVLRAFAACDQFDPETNLRAWSFTILRNLFFEQARRQKREREAMHDYTADALSGAPMADDPSQIWDLDRMLWSLPPLMREALTLVGAHGMSYEEAAEVCDVAVGTMKARVSRARRALMELRDDEGGVKAGSTT